MAARPALAQHARPLCVVIGERGAAARGERCERERGDGVRQPAGSILRSDSARPEIAMLHRDPAPLP